MRTFVLLLGLLAVHCQLALSSVPNNVNEGAGRWITDDALQEMLGPLQKRIEDAKADIAYVRRDINDDDDGSELEQMVDDLRDELIEMTIMVDDLHKKAEAWIEDNLLSGSEPPKDAEGVRLDAAALQLAQEDVTTLLSSFTHDIAGLNTQIMDLQKDIGDAALRNNAADDFAAKREASKKRREKKKLEFQQAGDRFSQKDNSATLAIFGVVLMAVVVVAALYSKTKGQRYEGLGSGFGGGDRNKFL